MKKIQNTEQIHSILTKIMGRLPCQISVDGNELPAGFVSYHKLDNGLELRLITEQKDHPSKRFVIMYHQGKSITVECKFTARRGKVELSKSLTEREHEILKLTAKGVSNKGIADTLCLSIRTVQSHLSNIFKKISVGSRTEAILYGLRRGWFTIEDLP